MSCFSSRRAPVATARPATSAEQLQSLQEFTGADEAVCRRVLRDCRGDLNAASTWLLLSGGQETMAATVPAGCTAGSTLNISTPRGMVTLTVPDGVGEGDTFTFALPEVPSVSVPVARARLVDGAPVSQASAQPLTASAAAAARGGGGGSYAQPTVVIAPQCYARPGYRYGYDPYHGYRYGYGYDPVVPLFGGLLLGSLLWW